MWIYENLNTTNVSGPDPRMAKLIIEQYGGPDGELSASLRYLTQRYTMPLDTVKGLLTRYRYGGTGTSGNSCNISL